MLKKCPAQNDPEQEDDARGSDKDLDSINGVLDTMLKKFPAQNAPEQGNEVRSSNKDLASENARLARENTRMGKDLIQALENASMWEENYHEGLGRGQTDSTRWRRMYHETYDEHAKLREEFAKTKAQEAKNVTEKLRIERMREAEQAKKLAELQTKFDLRNRHVGQLEGHNERLKRKLSDQTQAINNVETIIAANAKSYDEQYATITSLKSEKNRQAQKITELEFKLSTSKTHQDAAVTAAVKAATERLNEERSRSISRLKKHRGEMMPEVRRRLAKSIVVKAIQSGATSKPKRSIVASKSKKAAAMTKALSVLRGMQSQNEKITADLTKASSALDGMRSEKERIAADLTKASSDLKEMQSEKEKIAADWTKASSDLNEMQSEKEKIAADLIKASSDLNEVQSEKEKIAADLTKASSDLKEMQSEKEKIAADLTKASSDLLRMQSEKNVADSTKASSDLTETQSEKNKIAVDLTKALSDLKDMQLGKEKIVAELNTTVTALEMKVALVKRIQQENQVMRSHVCDHTLCQQQLQAQAADIQEALRNRNEVCSTLRDSNNEHEKTKADLSSIKRELWTLRGVHSECNRAMQPQDKMDVVEPADEPTDQDNMEVDAPQQILIDRLDLAQETIKELQAQNAKFLEVMRGNRDEADVLGDSSFAAVEERIREKVLLESQEERGSLWRRIGEQTEEIKKKDEKLKHNNVSQRLQDELKAAKEKSSKLEYDLSTLRQDSKAKPIGASTAPTQNSVGQSGPSYPVPSANETIQRLKFELKRLNKETKDAKANYDRVDKVLFKRDQKACEDLRNVEKVRVELGGEIERLQKKIAGLEAGGGDEPPPASDTTAPAPGGQEGGVSAGGKRAWDGEGVGREAVKKMKE